MNNLEAKGQENSELRVKSFLEPCLLLLLNCFCKTKKQEAKKEKERRWR